VSEPICSIVGCERPTKARGWCNMHWLRWKRSGATGDASTRRVPIVGGPDQKRARQAAQARARRARSRKPRPPLQTPEERREHRRDYRQRNLDAEKCRQRKWNAANQRIKTAHQAQRRARAAGAVGTVKYTQIAARLAYFGGRCWLCGESANAMDHVKPLSAGGPHWASNLRPVCTSCNSRKGDTWPYRVAAA
jgi:5-methylcytosine-specific restriction endonuclease McrA